jgi:hypothetical protein
MTYEYRISGDDVVIIGVEDVPAHGISLQDFKHPIIFWQIVEESCTFQKIYRVGKVKLQTKWPGRFEKTQI